MSDDWTEIGPEERIIETLDEALRLLAHARLASMRGGHVAAAARVARAVDAALAAIETIEEAADD